jgi:hypothetical protein
MKPSLHAPRRLRKFGTRPLSPLELPQLFCPSGCVPALIWHEGRIVPTFCPLEFALGLPTEGEA